MRRDPVVVIVVAIVITFMLVFGVQRARHAHDAVNPENDITGKLAPDFSLQSIDGKTVHLSDYRGKAVLLNFWATWCEPCKIETPWFVQLQNQYGPAGLQVLGVNMDEDSTSKDIAKFAKDMGMNYPVVLVKEGVTESYGGLDYLPASFYIDRDGKVVDKVFGLKGRAEVESDVKKALASGQAVRAARQ
ncbi:MAG: TlpA disulfide reductase family protein [Acidobacteriaceae bacterium]